MNYDEVILTINTMIFLCEPIQIKDFNMKIKALDINELRKVEKVNEKVGINNYGKDNEGISVLSL